MKKTVKLIALDIDGTLIDDEYNVSNNTREIIRSLVEKGIHVSLVTGRPNKAADYVRKQIDIDLPILSHNGGRIILEDGREVSNIKISNSMAKEIIKYGEESNLYIKVIVDDIFYVDRDNEEVRSFSKNYDLEYRVVGKLSEDITDDCSMILFFFDEPMEKKVINRFKDMDIDITTSIPNSLEFMPKGVSKGEGLKRLAKILGVDRDEILAVGNSLNDLSMLQFAGTGIAMKNSDDILLKQWDNISEFTNNEEGVYHILREIEI